MKTALKTWAATGALLLAGAAGAVGVPGQGSWESTLQPRDLDGDTVADAFYDTELDITWLRNANANGRMNWNDANAWAANLVVGTYKDWRLPTMIDTGAPGCDRSRAGGTDCGYNVQTKSGAVVFSEMAHLWYETLNNKAVCSPGDEACSPWQPRSALANTGGFQDLQSAGYWTGLKYAIGSGGAWWYFETRDGGQGITGAHFELYALAVRPGDVAAAIPEPGTTALLLIGLGVLAVARRRQAAA